MKIVKIIKKISDILNQFTKYIVIFLMCFISILIFIQVVARYVFNHSLYWSEEVGRYLLIWITFLGAAVGVKYGSHIGVDFFYKKLSLKKRKIVDIFIDILGLFFSFIMIFYGFKLSWFVRFQKSAALLLPMTFPYASIAVGGMLIFIHYLAKLLEDYFYNKYE